jgi:hypothetical protein
MSYKIKIIIEERSKVESKVKDKIKKQITDEGKKVVKTFPIYI